MGSCSLCGLKKFCFRAEQLASGLCLPKVLTRALTLWTCVVGFKSSLLRGHAQLNTAVKESRMLKIV